MEMEVMIPTAAATEFNFDSACTTPYISAPSSPQRFGNFFFSAPTSPTRVPTFYDEFKTSRGHHQSNESLSSVPFDWEEKPGIPKSKSDMGCLNHDEDDGDNDFAFDFSGQLEMSSLTADELFDGGKIKPLKLPPRLQHDGKLPAESSNSPRSPRSPKQMIKEAFSPRHRKKDFDPFAAALEQSRKDCATIVQEPPNGPQERGRQRDYSRTSSIARKKGGRSLSPFRVSDLLLDVAPTKDDESSSSSSSSLFSTSSFVSFWYRKWKLKDLLLFRSASEGHATTKEELNKYAILKKSQQEDVKNSSFRSTDSAGSVSSSRRRGTVSAHELHYTAKRAMAEEMRRKTSLPYKPGFFGCLGFNPGGSIHDISKSFGSMSRERS